MSPFDASLGTIRCETNKATIDALLFPCGLRSQTTDEPHHFRILDGARDAEPEVSRDLWELALHTLRDAERSGSLPPFSVAAHKPH